MSDKTQNIPFSLSSVTVHSYISELAALIKDKNRNIDKLELNLEKQQDGKLQWLSCIL